MNNVMMVNRVVQILKIMEPGKLFVGGISWDTNEDRLREYFQTFGEVVEAVIMKDRATGRARGFGFVIYADPAVAERVVRQKHMIDGRTVEAKKAVPRDDQHILPRNHSSPVSSPPVPARTKKIFVGGLASTVTEGDFKKYFDQFGIVTDVVVMYDHNTQRARGFGFITFDSEDAVERALTRNFHELNGKMVEVKRAVPKELSPGPNRSPLGGGNSGLTRVNSFLNGYAQGYNASPTGGGHGVKVDERLSPMSFARSGFTSFSLSGYGNALNYESRMSPSIPETANLLPKLSFEQGLNAFHNTNMIRHDSFADYDGVNKGCTSCSSSWSLWGNGSTIDSAFSGNTTVGFRGGDIESNAFKNSEAIWNSSPLSIQTSGRPSVSDGLSLIYNREISLGSAEGLYGRDLRTRSAVPSSFASLEGGYDTKFDSFDVGGSEQPWPLATLGMKGSGSFEFGIGNAVSDVPFNNPAGLCW